MHRAELEQMNSISKMIQILKILFNQKKKNMKKKYKSTFTINQLYIHKEIFFNTTHNHIIILDKKYGMHDNDPRVINLCYHMFGVQQCRWRIRVVQYKKLLDTR